MPTGKQNIQGAYWNGKIYVPGGFTGAHITENAIYDIASNTWSLGAPLPATQTGTNVAFNNKVYVFGGNPGPQSATRIYDIATNTWSTGASMPVATTYGRAARAGSFAYYAGRIATSTTAAVYRYDFTANTWATMNPLQTPRASEELMTSPSGASLFAVMGGDSTFFTGVPLAQSVEIYDIATNAWSYGNPVVTKAAASSGGLAGGKAMVQGGVDNAVYYDLVQVSTLTGCGGAPTAQSAVSRKTHGAVGDFDVPLPLSGTAGVECRRGGGASFDQHQLVVTFLTNVTVGGVTVTSPDGGSGAATQSASGAVVTINMTGVTDQHNYMVTLTNVSDGTNTGDVAIPIGILRGDTNGDRNVNSGDALQTRNRSGQTADATNFRSDVNTDGTCNAGDTFVVRSASGDFLP